MIRFDERRIGEGRPEPWRWHWSESAGYLSKDRFVLSLFLPPTPTMWVDAGAKAVVTA